MLKQLFIAISGAALSAGAITQSEYDKLRAIVLKRPGQGTG